MTLKVIHTGSAGNCYVLRSHAGESLLIECGTGISQIKQALNFDLSQVAGCLVSHEHADHCKGIYDVLAAGIDTYALTDTHFALGTIKKHRAKNFTMKTQQIGSFKVLPFLVKHDVPCAGFLIQHKECGKLLFITDSYYCPFVFSGLNNIIAEANYSDKLIRNGSNTWLKDRILKSHMSLETCCGMLEANDLTKVNNIVLIHLSDTNSDERLFKKTVEDLTGKNVHVASNNMEVEMGITPF